MVDIKDISGNLRFSTPINEGSKRHFLLMKEDYITLKFSSVEPVYFKLGDYIDNELGMFELVDLYKPAYNTTTGAYDYELRLDAYYWKWKNKKFFYTPETTGREAGWNLTSTLDTHLNVFLDNLKALGYKFREEEFTYEIDNTVANTSKLVSYDNVNLIDALTQMAETWECEWWIENKTIHFGRCEYSSPVDFKAGDLTDTENVNVNSMQRSDSQTTYATRVYAFGSTRNIPASYRKSLIFDVKKVKGRDISDTARPLDIKYFPISSQIKGADIDVSIKHTEMYDPDFPKRYTVTIAESLKAGKYLLKANGSTVEGYFQTTPPANSTTKAIFTLEYNNGDSIKLAEMTVQNRDSWPEFKLVDMPFTLNGDALNCRLSISLEYSFSKWINVQYKGMLTLSCETIGANTSVTFLSGSNAGQTFDAVYNPDLLTGDNSNVIRLPEGVTTSLNDRYTINNIIKGKVPDNYFSKDDKELTLNGVVQKRLMLPEGIPYVDAYKYSPTGERIDIGDERYDNPDNVEMPEEEAIEEIVIFEDEYPKYIGSVSSISHEEKEEIDEETKKPTGNKYPIYTFKDYGLKNFTKDFLLEELHLIFQTGKLAGLDFALNLKESDNTGTTFEIVRNEDYGRALPDDVLFPQAAHMEDGEEVPADTYVLYGFDTAFISEQMLPDAEQELLKKAKEYVKKSMIDPSTYDCEMDADFIYNKGNIRTYEVGAKVNLINKAFFPEGRQSRIIGFEWPLDIPYDHPIYTVGETASYSRIGEIESKLDSLTYKGQTYSGSVVGVGGTSIYVIGVNDKTLPSDRNVFSSQKSLATFLNKTQEETMDYLIKLLGGVITDKIESQNFISGALGTGFLVKRDPKTGRSYAEFDEIYVRLKAVFESLTIKELQSVGGEILLTLASIGCTKVEDSSAVPAYDSENARLYDSDGKALFVPKVENGVYRCYFTADDGEKAIINQFAVGDLAQCRQFNIKEGAYTGVSNRYYWRYVVAVGDNYIDLSVDDCAEGSDIPRAGDKIIQLGHRTDPARQNAILLSAYGLTAPTIQMLQGINSYSLDGKAVKEEGFDQETQQFYSKNYGRSYIGTKERTSYIEYTPENGVEMNNGTIKLHLDENNVWEVNKKCINIIGDKNGKHIEINPETRSIDIFDEKNNKVTTLDGSNYVGRDFWGGDMPVLSIINIPIEIEGTTGFGVLWNYSLCERIHITNTTTELKYGLIADIAITGDDSKDYISMSFEIQVYPDMTSNTPSNTIVIEKIKKEKDFTGTLINVESSIVLPMGFVEVKCSGSARKSDYNNVNTLKVRRYITSLVTNVYISKYFANGLVLGDSSNNIFSVINEDDTDTLTGQETRLDIHAYNYYSGIKIVRNGVFLKNNQHWGVMPSVIFNGRVWGSAQARLYGGKSWNGDFPTMTRESTGTYKFVFPSSWDSLSLTLDKYYLLLTPIATTGSATHLAVYHMEISHFIVTSVSINNAVFQNADFWIEMKWMN